MSLAPNHTIDVRHLQKANGKETYPLNPDLSGITCYIEPLAGVPESLFENVAALEYFQAYDFEAIHDIRRGDEITDDTGAVYHVRGVKNLITPEVGDDMEIFLAKKA